MLHKEGFFEVIEGGVDGSKEYSWNIHQIVGGTNVCDNVVVPLMKKIHRLPLRMVRTLQVASCLGFHFDLTLLEPLVVGDEVNTDKETQTKTRSALYSDVSTLLGEGLIEQIIGAEHRFKFRYVSFGCNTLWWYSVF